MKIIGITGRMGSGKTTLAKEISDALDIPRFDCDMHAKLAYENQVIIDILKYLPYQHLVQNNKVDKAEIAELIFSHKHAEKWRAFIQHITRPFVINNLREYVEFYKKRAKALIVECANPEFFDTLARCDFMLVRTTSNEATLFNRCLQRKGNEDINEARRDINRRLAAQPSEAEMLDLFKEHRAVWEITDEPKSTESIINILRKALYE